MHNYTVLLYL